SDFDELSNRPIRTMVIRNWKDTNFLHTVFLRLNTGSVNLSPQELRQALLPGEFSDYIDEAAGQSPSLRRLLNLSAPDPRMRDIEILARFLAFRFFADQYPGRMKLFLDDTFDKFNGNWNHYKPLVVAAQKDFESGVDELIKVFQEAVARKPTSPQFNRAIFDALIFFHSQQTVRNAVKTKGANLRKAYQQLFDTDSGFLKAVESDTAGSPNTAARLNIWGKALSKIADRSFSVPKIPLAAPKRPKSRVKKASTKVAAKKR